MNDCKQVDESMLPKRTVEPDQSVLAFHFLRHFPALVGWLPAHTPHLAQVPRLPSQKWKPVIALIQKIQE